MGGLFSSSKRSLPELYVDIVNAEPKSESEKQLYDDFQNNIFVPAQDKFQRFSAYQDGQQLAAESLNHPSPESKEAAWEAIYPNIQLQMEMFKFAKSVSKKFSELLETVTNLVHDKTIDVFVDMPIAIKCFVNCFDIILTFDEIKLRLPKLLNDLAFFRRNAPSRNQGDLDDIIHDSNTSTIFWAAPTPMLSDVINTLQATYTPASEAHAKILDVIGCVSDVCTNILKNHRFDDEQPNKLCLRCIVGSTLIYDHLSPTGAFTSKTKFHVKEAMELLVGFEPKQVSLINAIKYSSKNLDKDGADPKITNLFK
ncbi:protein FAM49B isoform X1 [Histomonas meleagridis]|uniref:protein FAM49B isoform X1 n=1 Tax=Histomonas meleagridis TaxID=135588 RepID=UPI00355AB512|nr:protein FAM49B isoform X1 [Histomonas meleagridis]KAH0799645.1 protein FAM49B isoform X1 [Histomonas meleagridis]